MCLPPKNGGLPIIASAFVQSVNKASAQIILPSKVSKGKEASVKLNLSIATFLAIIKVTRANSTAKGLISIP
ncbi:hypothetical protein MiAbW_03629 [Microcystis aeruginosa NIES-4325]|uniref:Uncharacterized protein n=1 Tax=Microcystis aeruginosa NIES-4325 TaxID=2569534 RepID=A0A5J4FDG1_MICAE|nr:hypothetical protein MiAbW_03629 [Microcystis aeruginosa NIES-4325]